MTKLNIIIISASSDIGLAICRKWVQYGWNIFGTYRTMTEEVKSVENSNVKLVPCDLNSIDSIDKACSDLIKLCHEWDALILCPGTQEPIGPIIDTEFNDWEKSIRINFINQIRIVHRLLPYKKHYSGLGPCVLFFAGGGTNNATVNYSAYTISKIALIKMCELLDEEIQNTRFTIIGPGWVKTKIHDATMNAKEKAGDNFNKTRQKLKSDECTPMEDVINCCEWILQSSREVVSGRNFSVVFDMWGDERLSRMLLKDKNMYKLRRKGNGMLVKNMVQEPKKSEILDSLILSLPELTDSHAPGTQFYNFMKKTLRKEIELLFNGNEDGAIEIASFGKINFPYFSMGNIDSLNLFDLDEIMIFTYYWANRHRYKKVIDIGANIGLHSIMLSKCGYNVTSYEPDPVHFQMLNRNLMSNNIHTVKTVNMAVSSKSGEMEFVRIKGNTTGSHLAGSKPNPYGDLDRFNVKIIDFNFLLDGVDFIKMDVEGHEKEIIINTSKSIWERLDAFIEIENKDNAEAIYEHFKELGINLFSQKINWAQVGSVDDMPINYKEGTLFVSNKKKMVWN